MSIWPFVSSPQIVLGNHAYGFPGLSGRVVLTAKEIASHKHCIGTSGSGKSKILEAMYLQLLNQGIGVSFIDPHSDSAEAILAALIESGFFKDPRAYERLLYIEFVDRDYADAHFLPFNVLQKTPTQPQAQTIASNVLEAFHRAWPELAEGAPTFDNLILASSLTLTECGLPLTAVHRLLTDGSFRNGLLQKVSNPHIVSFFQDRFDAWSKSEAPQMIESTLRRLFLLTFAPVLQYSLGQAENALDFRAVMDSGQSVIFNLGGIQNKYARRLLGGLICIGYEQAALSRKGSADRRQHHLLLDEFSDYCAQSEDTLSDILSQTRKFGLFVTMAHQTWHQANARLQGALQNVRVRVVFQLGRSDAEILVKSLLNVDPDQVKHEITDPNAIDRSHPVFASLPEQWERHVQSLVDMTPRHALVKITGKPAVAIKTINVPTPKVTERQLEHVKQLYRSKLMRPKSELVIGGSGVSQKSTAAPLSEVEYLDEKQAA